MTEKYPDHTWKAQKLSKHCETVQCPDYDNLNDFKRDSSGAYVLIKVNFMVSQIEVGVCNKNHTVEQIFRGKKSQDIYNAIFKYEKAHDVVWFKERTHIAYLGKELKKAELALVMGNSSYFQE